MSNGKQQRNRLGKGGPNRRPDPAAIAAAAAASGGVELVNPEAQVPLANKKVPRHYVPFGNRICCWVERAPTVTAAGIILPGETGYKFQTPIAHVIAIGPEVKQVKVGDRVLIPMATMVDKVFHNDMATVTFSEDKISGVLDDKPLLADQELVDPS